MSLDDTLVLGGCVLLFLLGFVALLGLPRRSQSSGARYDNPPGGDTAYAPHHHGGHHNDGHGGGGFDGGHH